MKTPVPSTSGRGAAAFQTGIQALAQYLEREGGGMPGRGHVERLRAVVSMWIANQKQRRAGWTGRSSPRSPTSA